jgi:hypothetical protein
VACAAERCQNRVFGKRFVAHRKAEREAEHGPCLLRGAVALRRRERLDELVDPAHRDLAQGEVLEGRHDELAHVALVERTCAQGDLAFEVEVAKPDLDQAGE